MRFSTAAVVSGLVAVAAADNGWGHQGAQGWGESSGSWGESSAVASSSSSAAASSSSPLKPSNVWVTDVVTAFTTYCPEATAITHGGSTYSVTSATTLTITNCPGGCTITRPVSSSVVSVCKSCSTPEAWSSTSIVVPSKPVASSASSPAWSPKPSAGTGAPWKPTANATTPAYSTGSWASASSTPSVVPYKGAASKTTFGFAGLIAAVGLVAAL